MNLKILFLCFVLFTVCKSSEGVSKSARDFWKAYFGIIKGKDYKFNEDCLSGRFDMFYNELINDIAHGHITNIIPDIEKLINLEYESCPLHEFMTIQNDLKTAFRNGTFIKNLLKNSNLLEDKIKAYMESDKSACAAGTCLGQVTKILAYGAGFNSWVDPHEHNEHNEYKNFLN